MEKKKYSKKEVWLAILAALLFVGLVAAVTLSSISDTGADKSRKKSKTIYTLFDTEITVYDYTDSSTGEFNSTVAELRALFEYYDSLFDIYDSHGSTVNLYDVNAAAGGEPVEVDPELIDFLKYAKEIHGKTNGEVNIAMGAVLSIWHEERRLGNLMPSAAKLPDAAALAEAALHCDINDIIIDEEASTVRLSDPEMSLDVGAVGKGYAAERAAELLYEKGLSGYALDVGGNLRVIGTMPSGAPWTTGIKNPDPTSQNRYVYTFALSDGSAATSGGYERYYTVDGKRYHHIIDKDTLYPPEYFSSVTVISYDAGLADSLSTALFCMSYENGLELIESTKVARAVWVLRDGTVLTSENNSK